MRHGASKGPALADDYDQRRHRDSRDMHRRGDRRDDDYRRRDRSRDRRDRHGGRERSPDRRRRSRDRDFRDRRDDSRDRQHRRHDDHANSYSRSRPDDGRDRRASRDVDPKRNDANPPAPAGPSDEQKKVERLAKLEAWKKKMAEEKLKKEQLDAGGTRELLKKIDERANASPASPAPLSPVIKEASASPSSPAPYAGKFDPKAIAKRAATEKGTAGAVGTLDSSLPVKELAKTGVFSSVGKGFQADKKLSTFSSSSTGMFIMYQIFLESSTNVVNSICSAKNSWKLECLRFRRKDGAG